MNMVGWRWVKRRKEGWIERELERGGIKERGIEDG